MHDKSKDVSAMLKKAAQKKLGVPARVMKETKPTFPVALVPAEPDGNLINSALNQPPTNIIVLQNHSRVFMYSHIEADPDGKLVFVFREVSAILCNMNIHQPDQPEGKAE